MFCLNQGHNRVPIKSRPRIEEIKPRLNDRMELPKIIVSRCIEDRSHSAHNLTLIRRERLLLRPGNRAAKEKPQHNHADDTTNPRSHSEEPLRLVYES
jgi:hypothetical protein